MGYAHEAALGMGADMTRMRLFAVVSVVLLLCTGCTRTPPRTVSLLLPRTGLQSVALDVDAGDVTVQPSGDGTIHVDVTLTPAKPLIGNWTSLRKGRLVREAKLTQTSKDGTLALALVLPAGVDTEGVSVMWSVLLPPVMHVHARLNAGHLEIGGVAGGVEAKVGAGDVEIGVPYGAVDVGLDTGNIDAILHSMDYGLVSLSTDVGKASLSVNGAAAGSTQQSGLGQKLSYQGSGSALVKLEVKAGDVSLSLDTR
jgi:hypothetical protein